VNDDVLGTVIGNELRRRPAPAVVEFAAQIAARAPGQVVAVLFYGSALRTGAQDGVLDFYVLLDDVGAWPASRLATLANRLLPPNVSYLETRIGDTALRAKVAIMSLARFNRGMSAKSIDTTLWARFSQPSACAFARADGGEEAVIEALCRATLTAAHWAALLGPVRGDALAFWRALYARTYGAELRVESALRGKELIDGETARYARLLPAAWQALGLGFEAGADGSLEPQLSPRERARAARRWALRRRLGKLLNLLRLVKSAFTFEGAMDYVAWKVERHSGVRLELSPWQRRHPLLAAPGLYWKLRRHDLLR
jgi:hypothetical protein